VPHDPTATKVESGIKAPAAGAVPQLHLSGRKLDGRHAAVQASQVAGRAAGQARHLGLVGHVLLDDPHSQDAPTQRGQPRAEDKAGKCPTGAYGDKRSIWLRLP
jgi:hypothetical protein